MALLERILSNLPIPRGFKFTETMAGTYRNPTEGQDRHLSFTVTVRAPSLLEHLKDRRALLSGRITAENLCQNAPCDGDILIDPAFGRLIRYDVHFTADDGMGYRLFGQKDVDPWRLGETMTTLPATLESDDGREHYKAILRFDMWDLPGFLWSFGLSR